MQYPFSVCSSSRPTEVEHKLSMSIVIAFVNMSAGFSFSWIFFNVNTASQPEINEVITKINVHAEFFIRCIAHWLCWILYQIYCTLSNNHCIKHFFPMWNSTVNNPWSLINSLLIFCIRYIHDLGIVNYVGFHKIEECFVQWCSNCCKFDKEFNISRKWESNKHVNKGSDNRYVEVFFNLNFNCSTRIFCMNNIWRSFEIGLQVGVCWSTKKKKIKENKYQIEIRYMEVKGRECREKTPP